MKLCTFLLLCIGAFVVATYAEESVQESSEELTSNELESESAEDELDAEFESEEDESDFDLELDEFARRCRRRGQRVIIIFPIQLITI